MHQIYEIYKIISKNLKGGDSMQTQYYMTEWKANTRIEDLTIHIYTIPLEEDEDRHAYGGNISFQLSKINGYQTVVFFGQFIASFRELKNWSDHTYINHEQRSIKLDNSYEITLLERLLKKDMENRARKDYVLDKGAFRLKNPLPKPDIKELFIYPAIYLAINIEKNGNIVIGFERTHRFEYKKTLDQLLAQNHHSISEGTKVVDPTNFRTHEYIFKEVAPYTAGQQSPYLKQSIMEYYKFNNKKQKLQGCSESSKVVHVETKQGDIFPYLPTLLKQSCSFEHLPGTLQKKVAKEIKLAAHDRMSKTLAETIKIINYSSYLDFSKQNVLAPNLGYAVTKLPSPILKFGNGVTDNKIIEGIQNKVYAGSKAKVSFLVDPALQVDDSMREKVREFISRLKTKSKDLGVKLSVSAKPQNLRGKMTAGLFQDENLPLALKSMGDEFEGTVIVLCTPSNIEHVYQKVKKEFGGKQDIVTQFVEFDYKAEGQFQKEFINNEYKLLNILLGIYVKSGIQPWILGKNLASDCFVGLDVSHEDGRHTSGIIQIIGKDGRIIKQKSMNTSESGEIISWETLEDVIYDSIHAYQETYGESPQHITFHRDGKCRENLEALQAKFAELNMSFDYVEVVKDTKRRMAVYNDANKQWKTQQGLFYRKERMGYLCSTSPHHKVGMARPIKVVQKTENHNFHKIMNDVYMLSFMHIHSMLKTRLPISTHYADLSSTFHNRGLLHPRTEHEKSLPFV